jgi:hypothetical protein
VTPDTVVVTLLTPHINNFVTIAPAHNPAGPNNPITDQKVINFYKNVLNSAGSSGPITGALIGIQSTKPLKHRSNLNEYGDAVIYDAVGNIVAKGIHVYSINSATAAPNDTAHASYGIYWDCHNLNHRWVGNGTYLIAISTTDLNDKTTTTPIKVGFSR